MANSAALFADHSLDEILNDLAVLKDDVSARPLVDFYLEGDYKSVLSSGPAQALFRHFLQRLPAEHDTPVYKNRWQDAGSDASSAGQGLMAGLAAFAAFLQANVTGPPLSVRSMLFSPDFTRQQLAGEREKCLFSLTVDGLSVYQHVPHIELFCFARAIFTEYFPRIVGSTILESRWMRMRINVLHQRLISSGTSNARLSDSAMELQTQVEEDLAVLEKDVLGSASRYSTEDKVQFLLEKAQFYIMQGLDFKARENVTKAREVAEFSYALSGALGKRTKFQQTDIAQLVVFAKSKGNAGSELSPDTVLEKPLNGISMTQSEDDPSKTGPTALNLDDDTLLETIEFKKSTSDIVDQSNLPPELKDLGPEEQPQLHSLDQIILLTEATLKDVSSPLDKLNSEEILPYAVRVLSDKPSNWQIYTQALLVRSRIEAHRSRTQERSVLQLQAIVDQIIADTQDEELSTDDGSGIPQIQVTQFLPRPKASESAPVTERLKFIYQLNSPTRWEIETELAYAWSQAGSLVSALEIFKRLRLWPEVALCYHSVDQEDKAKQVVRRQLYHSSKGPSIDEYSVDSDEVLGERWDGEVRKPDPPHAPRLWCILGDLEQDPTCWQRAWEISKNRYARAQRSLGEYYTRHGDLASARDAYLKATVVNRQSNETWSRLGDLDLRIGNWDGAIIAYQQSIMIDDTDAKTYSNLGSALLSKYSEMIEAEKIQAASSKGKIEEVEEEDEEGLSPVDQSQPRPRDILRQALAAYKRGATTAFDNWKIWDNVITIAGRMNPPSYPEVLQGMRAVLRIRGPNVGEEAVDVDILRALVNEVTSRERPATTMTTEAPAAEGTSIYLPPRGSLARGVIDMVDSDIIPLITARAELWSLVERLSLYRGDYAGALSSAEKAWRIVTVGDQWLEDAARWTAVADATEALVSALENYGPRDRAHGAAGEVVDKGWRGKARSALRGVLGRAKEAWEDTREYEELREGLEELKS
ncbi:MAG: hypothetical protein M1818_007737 [Claussenomyces sp. TS43310]|nr:MAG: hypothetical protein M1818_007737 [Claussenomyces sp. TS43310]